MLINRQKGYGFIHVPKTGGTSLRHLIPFDNATGFPHDRPEDAGLSRQDLFLFGFTRNPWSRLVSVFEFCQRNPIWLTGDNADKLGEMEFKHWLMNEQHYMKVDGDKRDAPPVQQRPTKWWLGQCHMVGKMEDIYSDFCEISEYIGLPYPKEVPHDNATPHPNYMTYYDDESRDFIAEHHAIDIQAFNYRFDR